MSEVNLQPRIIDRITYFIHRNTRTALKYYIGSQNISYFLFSQYRDSIHSKVTYYVYIFYRLLGL